MVNRVLTASLRLAGAASAAVVVILCPAAQAADNTRYISITGKNANPCTLAQPCRTLQRGISQTPAGGEVRILDSGFFGNNATIRKSLTISGNGNTVYLGKAITIDVADVLVVVRGLYLKGSGVANTDGILISDAATVQVARVTIEGFSGHGIQVTSDANLFISDSSLRNNALNGLRFGFSGIGAAGKLTVDNSRFENNGSSGLIASSVEATITRSISSGNTASGFMKLGNEGTMNVTFTTAANNGGDGYRLVQGNSIVLESSVARGNGATGVYSHAVQDIVVLSNSVITNNVTGVRNGGGMLTRGNNVLEQNGTPVVGDMPGVATAF